MPKGTFLKITVLSFIAAIAVSCSKPDQPSKELQEMGEKVESRGIMDKDKYVEIVQVTRRIEEQGTISESDLKTILQMLDKSGIDSEKKSYGRLRASAALTMAKTISPEQQKLIWAAGKPLVESSDVNDQRAVLEIASVCDSVDSSATILPLIDSHHENIRLKAKAILEKKGLKAGDHPAG